jgi:hypothetical protein
METRMVEASRRSDPIFTVQGVLSPEECAAFVRVRRPPFYRIGSPESMTDARRRFVMVTWTRSTERRWRRIVDEWRQSGQTAPEFVKGKKGISTGMLYTWSSRFGRQSTVSLSAAPSPAELKLLPVELVDKVMPEPRKLSAAGALELVLPHGEVLRVPPDADLSQLGRVLTALRGGTR